MGKRKSTPRKASASSARAKAETRSYEIGNKKFKLNVATLRDIKKLQSTTCSCIPRLPFSRLIREIIMELSVTDYRIQVEALRALQESAEIYLTHLFEDTVKCAHHARRVTIVPKDIRLVLDIRGCADPGA